MNNNLKQEMEAGSTLRGATADLLLLDDLAPRTLRELEELDAMLAGPLLHVSRLYSKGKLSDEYARCLGRLHIAEQRLLGVAKALMVLRTQIVDLPESECKVQLAAAMSDTILAINGGRK